MSHHEPWLDLHERAPGARRPLVEVGLMDLRGDVRGSRGLAAFHCSRDLRLASCVGSEKRGKVNGDGGGPAALRRSGFQNLQGECR